MIPTVEPNGHAFDVGCDAPTKVVAQLVDIGGFNNVGELELDTVESHSSRQERRYVALEEDEEDMVRARLSSRYKKDSGCWRANDISGGIYSMFWERSPRWR